MSSLTCFLDINNKVADWKPTIFIYVYIFASLKHNSKEKNLNLFPQILVSIQKILIWRIQNELKRSRMNVDQLLSVTSTSLYEWRREGWQGWCLWWRQPIQNVMVFGVETLVVFVLCIMILLSPGSTNAMLGVSTYVNPLVEIHLSTNVEHCNRAEQLESETSQ